MLQEDGQEFVSSVRRFPYQQTGGVLLVFFPKDRCFESVLKRGPVQPSHHP
uniref:Uncharacterized protein n=1 Tax=viral metagenome TaxID=1070528 RepID=A0A6C0KR28_9ZZZZ